jgi:LPPG:FO 2-phospho-L-lactate transferase
MHVERTRRLALGQSLSQITAELATALGIAARLTPMTDDPVRTVVRTDGGDLPFQRYFVAERCEPVVRAIRFDGAAEARPAEAFGAALARPDLAAVVVCPSNPYLSVDPILAVPGVRAALEATPAPLVAVSPIVGGQALKGPAAKLMRELGADPSVLGVADHYRGLLDGLVIDEADAALAPALSARGVTPLVTPSVMVSDEDRTRLARETLALAARLRG